MPQFSFIEHRSRTILNLALFFKQKMSRSLPLFLYKRLFNKQLTENIGSIKFAKDRIRTADLWCWKRPLCQLNHNHCPFLTLFYISISFWPIIEKYTEVKSPSGYFFFKRLLKVWTKHMLTSFNKKLFFKSVSQWPHRNYLEYWQILAAWLIEGLKLAIPGLFFTCLNIFSISE